MIYETHWDTKSLEDCYVYHTTELPDGTVVKGEWDLRGLEGKYTGNIDFNGKRVLDVGTASGFNAFWMEKQGAEVVAFDQSDAHPLNVLPHWPCDVAGIRRMKRGFWHFHKAFNSRVNVCYGNIYDLPRGLGRFDYALMGSILLHLENPIGAIRSVANVTDNIIVADALRPEISDEMKFRPAYPDPNDFLYWWYLSPNAISKMLDSLGYTPMEPTFCEPVSPIFGKLTIYTILGIKR